ncbi:hypothetical protein DJ533_00015 (plasmid) [Acinetobacter defluvii]|uniref:Uncharacterized protein n=1 Tax=Acinetobacter defluvii TaxID=1871111 RepID=A0A2S2F805_9GAMM|nr:hypothetical protein [Acinetobacter defluvii]AWL27104.1 hypothetical protein DJ533_00015 [Acinetobacter defluvii]
MDLQKERKAFLKHWYENNLPFDDEDKFQKPAWDAWLAAKTQAIPEGFVLACKLSANYLFNQVPELGFKDQDEKNTVLYHLNYMASEFKESAKEFVKKDHEKQIAFKKEDGEWNSSFFDSISDDFRCNNIE